MTHFCTRLNRQGQGEGRRRSFGIRHSSICFYAPAGEAVGEERTESKGGAQNVAFLFFGDGVGDCA